MQNQIAKRKQTTHDCTTRHDQYCDMCHEKIPKGSLCTLITNPTEPNAMVFFYCAKCAFGLQDRKPTKKERQRP